MIKYKIALINVFWSEDDQNTRYFDSLNEQEIYFDNKASGHTSPLVNYNMGNNINTTVVYKDTTTRRPEEIIKSNYAIVYTVDVGENNTETILNRRYFFAYCRQDSGRQMIVDLSLDDVQTNYFRYKVNYDKAVIKRACLPRFKYLLNNKVAFDLDQNSPLQQSEVYEEVPKRLIKRTPLNFEIDESSSTSVVNQFFNNNIVGWEYIYIAPKNSGWNVYEVNDDNQGNLVPCIIGLQPQRTYTFGNTDYSGMLDPNTYLSHNQITGALTCLCVPVYKYNSQYGLYNSLKSGSTTIDGSGKPTNQITIDYQGLISFLDNNGGSSIVYARKFSLRPPFSRKIWLDTKYYNDTVLGSLVIKDSDYIDNSQAIGRNINDLSISVLCTGETIIDGYRCRHGVIVVGKDNNAVPCVTNQFTIDNSHQYGFDIDDIVGADKNYLFNPKLLSNQFYEVNLSYFSQNYKYDPIKLGTDNFKIDYNEALTPDVTKGYARLHQAQGLYIDATRQNLTGLVISNDQSLMVANDKLSEMLANNKNYFLQQALNISTGLIGDVAKGNYGGMALNTITGGLKAYFEFDNMRSSPGQVKNANGNVYFAAQIQPFKLAVEEYDVLPVDKEKFNDYCVLYGFSLNKLDTLANYLNIRFYFNYIEADLIGVTAPISNEEKGRIRAKFEGGIRFWNTDMIDYSKENYENELLDWREEVENEQI